MYDVDEVMPEYAQVMPICKKCWKARP
jgi:hypothetical protein